MLGIYRTSSLPLLASWAIRLGWFKGRYARYNVSELEVHDDRIVLRAMHGDRRSRTYLYTDIRRVWFERFNGGSPSDEVTSFRIDIIAQNLDVIFSITQHDCELDDPNLLLMEQLYQCWRRATWRHYHVVAAVICHEGRYLCMQRGDTRYAYTSRHWEFPGGKVEEGESEPDALRRELLEEMDYPVTVERHLLDVEHTYPDFSLTLSCWLCTAKTDQFTRREHIDHRWLTPSELLSLDWCAADLPMVQTLVKG